MGSPWSLGKLLTLSSITTCYIRSGREQRAKRLGISQEFRRDDPAIALVGELRR